MKTNKSIRRTIFTKYLLFFARRRCLMKKVNSRSHFLGRSIFCKISAGRLQEMASSVTIRFTFLGNNVIGEQQIGFSRQWLHNEYFIDLLSSFVIFYETGYKLKSGYFLRTTDQIFWDMRQGYKLKNIRSIF